MCFDDQCLREVEWNSDLRAYVLRGVDTQYYAAVAAEVGGCANAATNLALSLLFDQLTNPIGLNLTANGFADHRSAPVHDAAFTLFPESSYGTGPLACNAPEPPYEFKWDGNGLLNGVLIDRYVNGPPNPSDPPVCDGKPSRPDPSAPHYRIDLGGLALGDLFVLSSVQEYTGLGIVGDTFYIPFTLNDRRLILPLQPRVHTLRVLSWANMNHFSIPEWLYVWDWDDPDGTVRIYPAPRDIGLRLGDIPIGAEADRPDSPLRVSKSPTNHGINLVAPEAPDASDLRIAVPGPLGGTQVTAVQKIIPSILNPPPPSTASCTATCSWAAGALIMEGCSDSCGVVGTPTRHRDGCFNWSFRGDCTGVTCSQMTNLCKGPHGVNLTVIDCAGHPSGGNFQDWDCTAADGTFCSVSPNPGCSGPVTHGKCTCKP